jgi:hypothetical protein
MESCSIDTASKVKGKKLSLAAEKRKVMMESVPPNFLDGTDETLQ